MITLPAKTHISNARNFDGDKERVYRLVAIDKHTGESLIDVRAWVSRGNRYSGTVYAAVWISEKQKDLWLSGAGKAAGSGYNKQDAAIDSAFFSAGISTGSRTESGDIKSVIAEICSVIGHPDIYIID